MWELRRSAQHIFDACLKSPQWDVRPCGLLTSFEDFSMQRTLRISAKLLSNKEVWFLAFQFLFRRELDSDPVKMARVHPFLIIVNVAKKLNLFDTHKPVGQAKRNNFVNFRVSILLPIS